MKARLLSAVFLVAQALSRAALGQSTDGAWSQLASGPPARWGHVMVYDPPRDRLLVHGGWNNVEFLDDLWEYDLATEGPWRLVEPTGTAPSGRAFHSAIYHPVHDRIVIYGGLRGGALDEVWVLELGGSIPHWRFITTTGTPPQARYWHSAVFNEGRMTVFGGTNGSSFFDDTWELEMRPPLEMWMAPFQPVGTLPIARCCHEAIAVPVVARMVIQGGWSGSTELGDLWELPFNIAPSPGWTSLIESGAIGVRTDHVAVRDWVRDRMVVHGGVTGADRLGDAWAVPLSAPYTWSAVAPSGSAPAPRSDHAAVYDPIRDRMLVYGGNGGGPSQVYGDLWALTWGATTSVRLTCSGDTVFTPGDTVFVTLSFTNPFASPLRYGYTAVSTRPWRFSSGGGGVGAFSPVVQFSWGLVVPDTAAEGTNEMRFRVWAEDAPSLADSCTVRLIHGTTPTMASLIEASSTADEVRLIWQVPSGHDVTLSRLEPGGTWKTLAHLLPDGTGRIVHIDRDVTAGTRYGYRLGYGTGNAVLSEVWVEVPARPSLALHRAWYEAGTLSLDASLIGTDHARVDLIDPAGRRVLSRSLAVRSDARQKLSVPCEVPAGVYFVTIVEERHQASTRVLILK